MADEAEVEVPEEGVVEVNLEGDEQPKKTAEAELPEKEKPLPRVRPKEPPAADEATDALKAAQAAVDNEKRLRQAAEQTAFTERQRADQEAARRQTREQELQQARENAETRQLAEIETGIANATKEIASTQKELSSALAEGNFEKVAEVQTRLSKASAALDRYEGKKADYESRPTPTTEGAVAEQQSTVQVSPFDRYISGMELAAQTWLRAHPECAPTNVGGKADMNSKMMRGHYNALAQNIAPNTDDYFRIIEESTGYRKPEATGEEVAEEPKPKPKSKPVQLSAPPSREPPGSPLTGSSLTVRLTKEEQETARFTFPHLKTDKERFAEYAKNKVILGSEGKLGRTSH